MRDQVKPVLLGVLAVLIVFAFAWVLDPTSAMMHQQHTIRRGGTFIAYVGVFWVVFITNQPRSKS